MKTFEEDIKRKEWTSVDWKESPEDIDRLIWYISSLSPHNLWKAREAIRTAMQEAQAMEMDQETEDILFFAMRYALGRRTAVVSFMTTALYNRWKHISKRTREQIQEEIKQAIAIGRAGDDCDIKEWQKILEL